MNDPKPPVTTNSWAALRQFTDARIALGRAGVSLPTTAHLEFQLAHAQARDAVHLALDVTTLAQTLDAALRNPVASCQVLHSAATDRQHYLQRPDLGRRLDAASRERLTALPRPAFASSVERTYDLAVVVVDGLSALAISQNAVPFLTQMFERLVPQQLTIAPVCLVEQGRVAIGDEVAELLGAQAVLVLIGERPGLSSPDSMGLYLTWQPRVGLTDANRNCISNVRPAGLGYAEAAHKLVYLLTQARHRQLSGVDLKDETGAEQTLLTGATKNFLL
ncbi:ethanolamine ammonia-lyase subunit EutC [Rhodoferax sp. U11-2br]|uniref:ethanolamine ammonia-lyase subunit EutC n=1 Tax=Rhodoferax sp. U11-2br TaxID=2838878 RepID=UPI001BE7B84F|nr:ethanolamine ammonia-lyase subunit EutC [Rhodoferax sp. U11-2br]MBT3067310.1 ethanolamine ammonia-lyase subunit EutC [Rhodoferax sp. U11-2br]